MVGLAVTGLAGPARRAQPISGPAADSLGRLAEELDLYLVRRARDSRRSDDQEKERCEGSHTGISTLALVRASPS